MTLPNKITLSRIVLAIVFMFFFYTRDAWMIYSSIVIYIVAVLSDIYDGYLARKTGVITGFGKFFDPLADKILMTVVFISLIHKNVLSSWIISLILVREFLITGLRTLAAYKGVAIAASNMGKLKTVFQMTLASLGLLHVVNQYANMVVFDFLTTKLVLDVLSYCALFFTYLSAYDYIVKSKELFAGDL